MLTRLTIQGNNNPGLVCLAQDDFVLAPSNLQDSIISKLESALETEVITLSVGGTSLIGALLVANSKIIIAGNLLNQSEMDILSTLNREVFVFNSKLNAVGNTILMNDKAALVSKGYSNREVDILRDNLDFEVNKGQIWDMSIVGSAAVVTNYGMMIHPSADDDTISELKKYFKLEEVKRGTINRGNPFVGSGFIVNSNGAVAGGDTTGIELGRIDEAFGFMDEDKD